MRTIPLRELRDRSISAVVTSRSMSKIIIADNVQTRVSLAVRIVRLRKLDRLTQAIVA